MQNNFLYKNPTFIETFTTGFVKKFEFLDFTVIITYFVTDPIQKLSF